MRTNRKKRIQTTTGTRQIKREIYTLRTLKKKSIQRTRELKKRLGKLKMALAIILERDEFVPKKQPYYRGDWEKELVK